MIYLIIIAILLFLMFLCAKGIKWVEKKEEAIASGKMPPEELKKWEKAGERIQSISENTDTVSHLIGIVKGVVSIGLIAFAISVLASCEKFDTPLQDETSTVFFNVDLLGEGKPITRGYDYNEIDNFLQSCMPTQYNLTLKKLSNGNEYAYKTGEVINLPNGEYEVKQKPAIFSYHQKGWYYTADMGEGCNNRVYNFTYFGPIISDGPCISICDTIQIKNDGEIIVKAKHRGSALVFDKALTSKLLFRTEADTYKEVPFLIETEKNIIVFFFKTNGRCYYFQFYIVPPDNADAEKTFIDVPLDMIENGKYYTVNPNPTSKSEVSASSVSLTPWGNGGSIN